MARHPWILILYLLVVTVAAFALPRGIKPYGVAALFALQVAILAFHGGLGTGLLRIFGRLKFLFLFLVGVNGLLPGAPTDWYWTMPGIGLSVNVTGCLTGLLMSAQIALVVITTHVVRTVGDEKSFINGLRSLRVAPLMAYSLDTTLAMLDGSLQRGGGGGRGGGRGGDGGGGHRMIGAGKADGGVMALFRALKRRDLTPMVEKINRGLDDAARHAQRLGLSESRAHDVGVIGGIAAMMMAFKLVKILPGMPVMQGAKTVFFIPLYMLAADRTNTRFGGTIAGGIMGFIAFLNGDSRYGIFEILKHVVPGLVIDFLWPVVRRLPLRMWILVIVGLIAAAARTSTQFAMILALGSDKASLLVFPAAKLIPNGIAGLLSGLVSYPLLTQLGSRALQRQQAAAREADDPLEAQADMHDAIGEPSDEPAGSQAAAGLAETAAAQQAPDGTDGAASQSPWSAKR